MLGVTGESSRRVKTVWRPLLWAALTVIVVAWAFQAGVESFDRENCGPDATDCDLGFLRGAPWAGLALLGIAVLITGVEVWLARRRRGGRSDVTSERLE
jgi:hypothetical protein